MFLGSLELKGYAALAPMAGVADRAFRELCVSYGACYAVGEMASAKGISLSDRKSAQLLSLSRQERPAAVQLFGDDPAILAQAAKRAMDFAPNCIDLNMGCPAPKIAGNGGGAALMKKPLLAQAITKAVVSAVSVPVTVKLRLGWDEDSINVLDLAQRCEEAGAAAVCVHARTRAQMYAAPVRIDYIRTVKQALHIPVIGNGDVQDGCSAAAMLRETGCDLVMVGRGAMGRPWVFQQINAFLRDGTVLPEPPIKERMAVMLTHIERLCTYKGVYIGMREARKHAAWYMKGVHGAAGYRQKIGALTGIDQLRELADEVIQTADCCKSTDENAKD